MLKRFVPILAVAFITGFLFRIADESGVALFRMFGTQGIVVIGILGSQLMRSLQREDGVRRLEEQLRHIDGVVKVIPIGRVGGLPFWKIDSPRGHILLGSSDVPHSLRPKKSLRRFQRHVQAMVETAGKEGIINNGHDVDVALVLLRKGVNDVQTVELDGERKIALVNPEGLSELFSPSVA